MINTTFFTITDTSTGESVDMHKQSLSIEEQIEKAKEFFQIRANSKLFHPTKESIYQHMSVFTNDATIQEKMDSFLEDLSWNCC